MFHGNIFSIKKMHTANSITECKANIGTLPLQKLVAVPRRIKKSDGAFSNSQQQHAK